MNPAFFSKNRWGNEKVRVYVVLNIKNNIYSYKKEYKYKYVQ